jgi:glutamate synthase domain-containing protein 3
MPTVDLAESSLRDLNQSLHNLPQGTNEVDWLILNPEGAPRRGGRRGCADPIEVKGSVGYYCAGMNKQATIVVDGSAGPGVASNMMSGTVVVKGDASQYAGATGGAARWSSRAMPHRAAASP